jgi:hypothetical protein
VLNILPEARICSKCKETYIEHKHFLDCPPFLVIHVDAKNYFRVNEIPLSLSLNNRDYKFLCCNFKSSTVHFKAIFYINDEFVLVDDLNHTLINTNLPSHTVDVCFYYLE